MMRLKAVVFLVPWLCTCLLSAVAQTQDPHEAQPERPTVATHAGTVAPGWLELEAGGELDRYNDDSHGVVVPITIKLGLGTRTQLSLLLSGNQVPGRKGFALGDISLGVKWRIADDLPILGRFALLPSVKLPTGSTGTGAGTGTLDGTILLISSNDLHGVALDLNFAYTKRSGNGTEAPQTAALWTISFGGLAVGVLGWTVEVYGYPGTSGPSGKSPVVAVLFGPTVVLESWLVLDLGVIQPVVGPQSHAVYCGAVWNIGGIWP